MTHRSVRLIAAAAAVVLTALTFTAAIGFMNGLLDLLAGVATDHGPAATAALVTAAVAMLATRLWRRWRRPRPPRGPGRPDAR